MKKPETAPPRKTARPAPRATATPAAAKRAAPAARGAPASPTMHFHHSVELRARILAVLDALEAEPGDRRHGEALADRVNELVEAGMEDYFLQALKQAKVGFVAEQSARLGMSGAVKLISSVSRKFLLRMDGPQLLVVAAHIRSRGNFGPR